MHLPFISPLGFTITPALSVRKKSLMNVKKSGITNRHRLFEQILPVTVIKPLYKDDDLTTRNCMNPETI